MIFAQPSSRGDMFNCSFLLGFLFVFGVVFFMVVVFGLLVCSALFPFLSLT